MKTETIQTRTLGLTISKLMIALAFASVMSGLAIGPALAEDNDRNNEHHDNGWHKGGSHDRDRHEHEHDRHEYRDPHYYSQPVYAPPPVYYVPRESPGITVFLPLDIHIH